MKLRLEEQWKEHWQDKNGKEQTKRFGVWAESSAEPDEYSLIHQGDSQDYAVRLADYNVNKASSRISHEFAFVYDLELGDIIWDSNVGFIKTSQGGNK